MDFRRHPNSRWAEQTNTVQLSATFEHGIVPGHGTRVGDSTHRGDARAHHFGAVVPVGIQAANLTWGIHQPCHARGHFVRNAEEQRVDVQGPAQLLPEELTDRPAVDPTQKARIAGQELANVQLVFDG